MNKRHNFSYDDRIRLETMLKLKVPVSRIASELGYCRQTIYNEIRRGTYLHNYGYYDRPRYSSVKGQSIADKNKANKGRPLKIGSNTKLLVYLEALMLKKKVSPSAALCMAAINGLPVNISVSTLYNYIYRNFFPRLRLIDLPEVVRRRQKRKRIVKRNPHPALPSIEQRPDTITDRSEIGHWEMDLVCGSGKAALLVLTERATRYQIMRRLPDKSSASVVSALDHIEMSRPGIKISTVTTDNGSEFLSYNALCASVTGGKRFNVYYCHAYCAWEKGTVERQNRLLRRWIPKGSDISCYSDDSICEIESLLNNYPRRSLYWRTPAQLMTCSAAHIIG